MNHPYPHPDSYTSHNLPSADGFRHAEVREPVDDRHSNVALGNLPVKLTGEQVIAQLFEPIHHVFGNAASVVSGILLPACATLGLDLSQEGIPGRVVSPGHRILTRRNRCLGVPLADCGMGACGVVGAISGDLGDLTVDLRQQVRENFAVVPVGGGDFNSNDIFGRFINRQLNLAPGAALANPVLADFPFAFAEYLQARGADHDMGGPGSRAPGYLHFQCGCPARQVGVIRHRQIQRRQTHQRVEQAFGGPVGQTEQGFACQAGLDRQVRVRLKWIPESRQISSGFKL